METGEGGGGRADQSWQWEWVCGDRGPEEDGEGVESILQRIRWGDGVGIFQQPAWGGRQAVGVGDGDDGMCEESLTPRWRGGVHDWIGCGTALGYHAYCSGSLPGGGGRGFDSMVRILDWSLLTQGLMVYPLLYDYVKGMSTAESIVLGQDVTG